MVGLGPARYALPITLMMLCGIRVDSRKGVITVTRVRTLARNSLESHAVKMTSFKAIVLVMMTQEARQVNSIKGRRNTRLPMRVIPLTDGLKLLSSTHSVPSTLIQRLIFSILR